MFVTAVADLVYGIYTVIALVGLVCIGIGVVVRRRGHGGRALMIIGAVIILLPTALFAASYLPGQQ